VRADRLERAPGDAEQRHHVGGVDRGRGGVAEHRLVRGGGRRLQRVGVGELFLLGQQRRVLAGHRGDRLDLGQAAPQRLRLGRALPLGPRQRLEFVADGPVPVVHPAVVGQGRGQLRAAEAVQRVALPAGLEQLLLIRLAVHGHQVVGQHLEQRHRDRMTAGEGPGSALGRDRTAEHERGTVVVEVSPGLLDLARHLGGHQQPSLHRRPGRARADPGRVGPAAEEQPERRHDHGLAGAGLAGQRGEPGRELEHRVVDDAEAGNPDFLKHACLRPPRYGRASPPRAGRT
jgi:hypothetical protein